MSLAPIPLIVVVGPTASGKSALAAGLAGALGGEVVNADAFAVYRGMDIGTAKPGPAERALAPHHLIDCCDPGERSDLARWLGQAEALVETLHQRRVPIVVAGGSPLYTKALLEGLSAGAPRDEGIRAELDRRWEADQGEALWAELQRLDPAYAAAHHANDRRRVVRALEVHALTGRPYSSFHTTDGVRRPGYRPLLLGLRWDKEALHRRINARVRAMFAAGLPAEVARLRNQLCPEALQAVGYKEVLGLLDGEIDQEHAIYLVAKATRHLAKHQMTWYRRWSDIRWLAGDDPGTPAAALERARTWIDG